MAETITINPVTRIEGHAKITLTLDGSGKVDQAYFHVDEFRGFEKFCEGRFYTEMPTITQRICGICPASHALTSAKACDAIQRVEIPPTAHLIRKLILYGQNISSHALSFFHLSSPDMLLGWDSPPDQRNILGLAAKFPDLARRGIRLRKFAQEISERITGKRIHSIGICAGGMQSPLKEEDRKALLEWLPEVRETARQSLDIFKGYRDTHREEVDTFAPAATPYMGLVGPDGAHELYHGCLRWVDGDGGILVDQVDPSRYLEFIAEAPVAHSYLKYPYFKPLGPGAGYYRVGPLARLNVASRMATPWAQKEYEEFRSIGRGRPVHGSFYFHYARLVEVVACLELIEVALADARVTGTEILAEAGRNQAEGIGCAEAPRGTLFHHYATHADGSLRFVNLLIATGQNNPSMNQSILEVARRYVDGNKVEEGALNRVEGAIRCYDPCLSCSTHALGAMPLEIEILDSQGRPVGGVRRGRR